MAFFFSAIDTQGPRKALKKNKTTLRIRETKVIASISQVKC